MPELPEVERVRQTLLPHLLHQTIRRAELRRRDICNRGYGASPAQLLQGDRIASIERRGKQLALLGARGSVLCIHLGMTGRLTWRPRTADLNTQPHLHALWHFDEVCLTFQDPRRFGRLWTLPNSASLERSWSGLGPDALTITPAHLATFSTRAIKALLLDQHTIAGVGNIYADEALFLAGIRPTRRANRLKEHDLHRLSAALRAVLSEAIAAGGSTLRDYRNANGEPGANQERLAVYGRAGLPCTRCARPLRAIRLAQRATVYCPRCQS